MRHHIHTDIHRAVRNVIEALEQRRLLAVTVLPQDTDGDGQNELIITGNGGVDRVVVFDDPANDRIDVLLDSNNNQVLDGSEVNFIFGEEFEEIEANMGSNNDSFRYLLVSDFGAGFDSAPEPDDFAGDERSVLVDLGTGNDTFIVAAPTTGSAPSGTPFDTDGADITHRGDLSIQVAGNSGNDTVHFNFSRITVECSRVQLDLDAGGSNDTVTFDAPDFNLGEDGITACIDPADLRPVTGSEVPISPGEEHFPSNFLVQLDLGSGTNTANLNIASDIEDDSTLNIYVTGGSGVDKLNANVSYGTFSSGDPFATDAPTRSTLSLDAQLGGSNDIFVGKMDFGSLGSFMGDDTQAIFRVVGNDGSDSIRYEDVTTGGGDSAIIAGLLAFEAVGGTGNDTCAVDLDTLGGARFTLAENGELRCLAQGDSGNDKCYVDLVAGNESDGQYDIAVLGGTGNDKVSIAFKNDGENEPEKYRTGSVLLDGGLGTDRWDFEGGAPEQTPPLSRRSCEIFDDSLQAPQ